MSENYGPEIIGHRGSPKVEYENTIASFEQSIREQADRIEFDIHETLDHVFVVHHDPIIDVQQQRYIISKTRYSEIEDIKLPNGSTIPRLEEVIEKFSKRIKLNIEIKPPRIDLIEFENVVSSSPNPSSIIISSFHSSVLEQLSNSSLGYRLAYLYTIPLISARVMSNKAYISALNPYVSFLSSRLVSKFHRKGKKVYPWVVNTKRQIERVLKLHVDGIITDYPAQTRKIVNNYMNEHMLNK